MKKEMFFFHDGINRKKSPLLLGEAEAYTLQGYSFEKTGVLEPRPERTANYTITTLAYQQGIHRYEDNVYAFQDHGCHGQVSNAATWTADAIATQFFNHIYRRGTTGTPSYAKIGISRGSDRGKTVGYKKFDFYQDGEDIFALDDQYKFGWRIPNPTWPMLLSLTGTGSHFVGTETFIYCYTYHFTFPNGETVETGPSPTSTITLASDGKIKMWPPVFSPEFQYSLDDVVCRVRIYRTADSGSTFYFLSSKPWVYATGGWTPAADNVDQYGGFLFPFNLGDPPSLVGGDYNITDDVPDASLILLSTLSTTGYEAIPTGINDLEFYLQKIFAIKDDKLYWSEDYLPFNWKSATNFITASRDGEDLVACCAWGDRLWLASKARWYGLVGSNDDTFAIKQTWTDKGVINRDTVKRTEFGILGLHYDGICLFNGYNNKCITESILGREFFDAISDTDVCYSEWDGRRYYFYYPTTGTTLSGCVVLDLSDYPQIKIFQDDFIATGHHYYRHTGERMLGKTAYEYEESGTETISSTWQTREVIFGDITERKALQELHYDIKGVASIAIYADGSLVQTISVSEASRKRDIVKLGRLEGYRFYLIITCAATSALEIYEPITLTAVVAGEI